MIEENVVYRVDFWIEQTTMEQDFSYHKVKGRRGEVDPRGSKFEAKH